MRVRVLKTFADDTQQIHNEGEIFELADEKAIQFKDYIEEVVRLRVKKRFIDKYTDEVNNADKVIDITPARANELKGYVEDTNKMSLRKIIFIIVGSIGVGLGAVGAALPFLPAFPFLLIAAICFGKSSDKLDTWFKNTSLYKKNLETYVKGQGMTWEAKIKVMTMVSILMAIGFTIMTIKDVIIYARLTLVAVWIFHIIYFCFGVKKYDPNRPAKVKKINREKYAIV